MKKLLFLFMLAFMGCKESHSSKFDRYADSCIKYHYLNSRSGTYSECTYENEKQYCRLMNLEYDSLFCVRFCRWVHLDNVDKTPKITDTICYPLKP